MEHTYTIDYRYPLHTGHIGIFTLNKVRQDIVGQVLILILEAEGTIVDMKWDD